MCEREKIRGQLERLNFFPLWWVLGTWLRLSGLLITDYTYAAISQTQVLKSIKAKKCLKEEVPKIGVGFFSIYFYIGCGIEKEVT